MLLTVQRGTRGEQQREVWEELKRHLHNRTPVMGRILNPLNGGYAVGIAGRVCFCPYTACRLDTAAKASSFCALTTCVVPLITGDHTTKALCLLCGAGRRAAALLGVFNGRRGAECGMHERRLVNQNFSCAFLTSVCVVIPCKVCSPAWQPQAASSSLSKALVPYVEQKEDCACGYHTRQNQCVLPMIVRKNCQKI